MASSEPSRVSRYDIARESTVASPRPPTARPTARPPGCRPPDARWRVASASTDGNATRHPRPIHLLYPAPVAYLNPPVPDLARFRARNDGYALAKSGISRGRSVLGLASHGTGAASHGTRVAVVAEGALVARRRRGRCAGGAPSARPPARKPPQRPSAAGQETAPHRPRRRRSRAAWPARTP